MQKLLVLFFVFTTFIAQTEAVPVRKFKPLKPMQIPTIIEQEQKENIQNNFSQPTENYPRITILEENIFKRTYENESIYNRLTRLEQKLFRQNFAGLPLASRVDNLFSNIDTGLMYGIKNNELARLETKVLGRQYPNDDTESRITRLEKEMLGAMQCGNLKERFETVKSASKHYNSFPEIVQSQSIPFGICGQGYNGYNPTYHHNNGWNSNWSNNSYSGFNTNPSRGITNILRNMASRVVNGAMGGGMITGLTPPIYDPYNPYAMTSGIGEQDYYWGNRGGYLRNKNTGGGSTVRILD